MDTTDSTVRKDTTTAIVLSAILLPACTAATILRFVIRIRDARILKAEDWSALASLILFYAYTALALLSFELLRDKSPDALSLSGILLIEKVAYISTLFVPTSQGFAKNSLLWLYYRIFSVDRSYRFSILAMVVINVLWMTVCPLVEIFRCTPIRKGIDPFIPGTCINISTYFAASEVLGAAIDFAMVGMAIFMLQKIKLSRRDRYKVSVLFAIGGFVGVISIIKVVLSYRPGNYNLLVTGLWDIVQLGLSVLCCCAPIYRSMLPKTNLFSLAKTSYASLIHTLRLGSASGTTQTEGSTDQRSHDRGDWVYLNESSEVRTLVSAPSEISGKKSGNSAKTVDVEQSIEMV